MDWAWPTLAVLGLLTMLVDHKVVRAVGKIVASSAMVTAAIVWGALHSLYGTLILVGLALSWLGDVALLSQDKRWFLAGLGLFLSAHVAYVVAFLWLPLDLVHVGIAAALAVALAVIVLRWLLPHTGRMRRAVMSYVAVICTMMAVAVGATPIIAAGAILFGASDLFVARHRFITATPINRLIGLPLYYAGQFLLAWSVTL